jgi:antirestriction protein ArdC
MINYVTKREYSGKNAVILMEAGVDAVLTFKQATRDLGIPGKALKGLKSCATLIRFDKDDKEESRPRFFSVFDAVEVLARKPA